MTLAVEPSVRRQGIASELVRFMLTFGRARGGVRAILEVRASNLAARGLYEQMGFRQTAVRTKYYANPTEDAILMEMNPLEIMLTDNSYQQGEYRPELRDNSDTMLATNRSVYIY